MTTSKATSGGGEPVVAWLDRRTAVTRKRELEFDDARLEYRRLFAEVWIWMPLSMIGTQPL